MKIDEIMTKKVITVEPSMSIQKLAEMFVKKNISGAPVVDKDGKFLGIVLEEGLIMQDKKVHLPTLFYILSGVITIGEDKYEKELKKVSATTVSGIMEDNVTVLSPDTSVDEVATIMVEKGIHYFPVCENGKIVGVITKKDIVKAIARKKI
ncbi:MAG: CBS domain-containing protein [Endomicrobiales bacterium]|nr:CBS domain-containing protein [Endomicrobiales bacterium]